MYNTIYQVKFIVPDNLMFAIAKKNLNNIGRFSITGIDNKLVLTEKESQEITKHFLSILDIVRK